MTDSRNPDQLIRAFLSEGVEELSDQAYDSVRSQLRHNHQRVVIGPWRVPPMTNSIRVAIAAIGVLVVAFLGFQFFGGRNFGGPGESPSQSGALSLEPTSSLSATPAATPLPIPSPLEPVNIGRNSVTVDGVGFSFEVTTTTADGWARYDSVYIGKSIHGPQDAEGMLFWAGFPDSAHADPCASLLTPPVGPSAADLAAAVSTTPGTELVSGPSDVTVGGRAAKRVVLTVSQNVGCQLGFFYRWQYHAGGPFWRGMELGDTVTVWIVEVNGTRLFIEGVTHALGAGSTQVSPLGEEIQQIVDSIRFD